MNLNKSHAKISNPKNQSTQHAPQTNQSKQMKLRLKNKHPS